MGDIGNAAAIGGREGPPCRMGLLRERLRPALRLKRDRPAPNRLAQGGLRGRAADGEALASETTSKAEQPPRSRYTPPAYAKALSLRVLR